ncbi:MAG: hypothetical protein ABIT05_14600 [Chitinophagaceae bacterium]
MKSILYVGATLMIGASIYGFVDYRQTSYKKEFTDMYVEEKTGEPVVVVSPGKTEPVAEPMVNQAVTRKTKPAVTKKVLAEKEETLPVIKLLAEDEKMNSSGTTTIEKPAVTVTPSKENNVVKRTRKLSTKLFSRGALDERYTEPKVKEKKESKKTEDKEQ